MGQKPTIALVVDEDDRAAVAAAQHFITKYHRVLSHYIMLVSERTATVCREVANKMGLELHMWVWQNRRSLVVDLVRLNEGHVASILIFFDAQKIGFGDVDILQQAAAGNSQKLIFNQAACLWGERQTVVLAGLRRQAQIHKNDSLIIVAGDGGQQLERFAKRHYPILEKFTTCIFTDRRNAYYGRSAPGWSLSNYYDPRGMQRDGTFCNVIAFANLAAAERTHGSNAKQLLQLSLRPPMRTNVMLDEATAEDWIEQYEQPKGFFAIL
jgi:hypothetical protein